MVAFLLFHLEEVDFHMKPRMDLFRCSRATAYVWFIVRENLEYLLGQVGYYHFNTTNQAIVLHMMSVDMNTAESDMIRPETSEV